MSNDLKIPLKRIFTALFALSLIMIPFGTAASAGDNRSSINPPGILLSENVSGAVQLQWYLLGMAPKDFETVENKLNSYLGNKTGITINFQFINWDGFTEKKNLLFAAGEPIDIIFTAGWWDYRNDAGKGLYRPLNDLLDKYAPKTKEILGKNVLKGAEINGNIYALPVIGCSNATASGIAFRTDLLKKYNIDTGKIKTLADAGAVLKVIKSKLPSVIPLVNNSSEMNFDLINSESFGYNTQCPGVISSTGKDNKVYNEFEKAETMSFLKTLYEFKQSGYLKKSENLSSDMINGKIFAILQSDMNPLSEYGNSYQWTRVYLGKPIISQPSATAAMNAVAKNSGHQAEALKVQELINTDAYLTNLLHFGIEGTHYVKVSGNVVDDPENTDSGDTRYQQLIGWMLGNRYLDFTWATENPGKYKDLKAFNDNAAASVSMGFNFDPGSLKAEVTACGAIWKKYVPGLLNGEYDPQQYLPILNAELQKAGLAKILAGKQQQYENWLKKASTAAPGQASSGIQLALKGETLTLEYQPILDGSIVLVPMDSIFKSFDSFYGYDAKTKTITASRGKSKISMTIGSKTGYADGRQISLNAAPRLVNGQVYVPLEAICKAFGFEYSWDKASNTASVSYDDQLRPPGNSTNNIANYGYSVSDSDYLYISLYNDGGTYKMKKDGTGKSRLVGKTASCLNIRDNWLYYVSPNDSEETESLKLYRIRKDGGGNVRLSDNQVTNVIISGDWIYYINLTDDARLYRMALDGSYNQKVGDDSVRSFLIDDGWIYFYKTEGTYLYKMRTSGTDLKILADTGTEPGSCLGKSGQWIYYSGAISSVYGIYKVKTDGTENSFLASGSINHINCYGGYIYYSDFSGNLYRINESQKTKAKIGTGVTGDLGITEDWIYAAAYDEYGESVVAEYRIKTDGSAKQKFDVDGNLTDVYKINNGAALPRPIVLPSQNQSTAVKTAKEIVRHKDAVAHIKIYDEAGREKSTGSGFNIHGSGIVVTNFHVVSGASSIRCTFDNNKTYDVDYILNYNQAKDVAILHLKDAANLPVVYLGDSDKVELADKVLAIGNPLEFQNTISDGLISGIRTLYGMKLLQTTASISPGSSGGPLFNEYGSVIGITFLTYTGAQNINFAVPSNYIKSLMDTAKIISIPQMNLSDAEMIEFESNDTLQTANPCEIDKYITGVLSDARDIDYFRLEVQNTRKITFSTFTLDSLAADSKESFFEISLLNQAGNILAKSENVMEEGYVMLRMSAELKAGTYYLSVKRSMPGATADFPVAYSTMVLMQ